MEKAAYFMYSQQFNLVDRAAVFTKQTILFCNTLPPTISNIEYQKQVIRSTASVGANYIEANEAFSKKDFLFRLRIARKEAKESEYWLQLLQETNNASYTTRAQALQQEAKELRLILSSIINKASPADKR